MQEPLALVGMACRLPGGDGLEEFWQLVIRGGTAWGPLPEDRFCRDLYYADGKGKTGKSYSELGGLVSDRPVDPAVCPLTADMVDRYDIAHQIFLEVASQACRDAGLDPFAMPTDRSTGVYVGHTGGSPVVGDCVYSTRIDEAATLLDEVEAARELLGSETATVAADLTAAVRTRYPGRQPGRPAELSALGAARIVREALRLEGPYLVVDAACASSLQALAIAARALAAGTIDQAIVGGASFCKSDSLVLFSAAQSVSNSGSCPFGRDADGLVTAEGYVALVLKTLSRAVADGDRIRAVIRGIGVASDGKGKSLWAPRQEGQKLAVERAYPQLADVADLDYVEAHATSTQVGDATELGALAGLLGPQLPPGRKIPIGSVKANVGHTLETAGLASLVKVVLAVEHGSIPPGSTARALNDQFDWQAGPFRVPRVPEPWPRRADGSPRQAAVNAFGIGGLNVHVAIAEYLPQTAVAVRSVRPAVPSAEPIAIVGAGCVLPGAVHLAAFETLLDSGQSAVGPVPADRWDCARVLDPSGPHPWQTTGSLGGFIQGFTYDWRRHKVPPKQIAAANPLQFMLLEAADAALAEAGFTEDTWDRTRMAVVVGTMFGGEFSHDLQIGLRLPETTRILRGLLAKRGLSGPECETVITAYEQQVLTKLPALIDETGSFTSSTLASRLTKSFNLMGGALALDAGDCSSTTAIAAAVDMLREGSSDAVVCAAGQRYMDLVAFEMLSLRGSLAADQRTLLDERGDGRIPGEGAVVLVLKRLRDAEAAGQPIRGVIRGVAVSAGGRPHQTAKRVIAQAAASALVPPRAVTAAEVSGVCHRQADQSLLAAIGEAIEQDSPIAVGAVDAMIGHTGAAAGAAGLLKLSRSLQSGVLPATTGLDTERIIANTLQASGERQSLPTVTAAGYRAGTLTEMHDDLVGHLLIDNGLPLPQPAGISGEKGLEMAPRPLAVRPVSADTTKIAALFPGQGSQYTGMLQGIAEQTPEGRAALADLDQLADRCGQPRLAEVAWREPNQLGTGVWETQWAMYLGDLFAWKVLRSLGFRPDIVASHSFGEFPALAAAGGWTEETGATATRGRADAVERLGPADGAMLSLQADRATVETVLTPLAGRVWRCAENAPEQTVVGGSARCIDALELLMEPSRVRSKRLAVPSPFHTPLLANAAAQLATTLAGLAITSPRMPIISSTTLTRLASPESVRESLIRQMTETVRWVELVEQLYADGVRVFVEVGPSGVLAGLTRRILAAHTDITIVQFDQRGRSPAEQLSRLRETLGLAGSPQRAVVADPLNTERAVIGRIVSFDATSRRRERNRSAALGKTSTAGRQPTPSASHNGNGHAHGRNGSIVQQTRVPVQTRASAVRNGTGSRISAADPVGGSDSYASVAAGGSSADAAPVHQAAESKELESFLVEFVVEQTGYPREIVELDADLEADLGIDSIRKAQLFGEIGQRYSLAADDSLSFDDFPTLRHLLDYMLQRIGGVGTGLPSMASSAARRDVVSSASVEPQLPAAVVGEAPVAIAEPKTADKTIDNFAAVGELSSFLIDFVIEQTGYPREIVDLDADLESDLGIDSIRKAQLFGEIGQRYGLAAEDSVSLDDFPTLQHLLDYMLPRIGGMEAGQASTVAAAFQRDAVSAAATEPPRLAAVAGEASVAVADSKTADKTVGSSAASEKLAAFLIDFVIEQTGYPQEIVELDADLEADLGIDSIRKAQLFGEIGQHYGLAVDDSVSLDDFPTLQHLLDYMLPKVAGTASEENSSPSEVMTDPVSLEVFRSGNFRLGEERGRQHAESIRRWARLVPTVASGREPVFPRALGEELDGIAAGAGVSAAAVRAAVADPTAVLGAWETAVSCTAGDSGVAVVCGRQASPVAETSNTEAGRTTLVGLPGLPAAVIGWNTSGLVAWIDGSGRSAAGNLRAATPTAVAVAAVARSARTPAEAAEILRRAAPLDGSVSLLMLPTRGLSTAGADGVLQPSGDPAAVAPPGGLFDAFLAGGEQSPAATTRLLLDSTSGVADRLSAAVHWVAVGLVDGQPVVRGGGPLAAWFDPHSLVLPQGRPPAVDEPGTAAAAAEVTRRYLLGCAPLPPAVAAARLVGERVLVLGEGAVAAAIAQAVQASGGEVTVAAVGSQQAAEAAVDAAESIGPVRHLVLAAAADRAADGSSQRINTVVTAAFFACQRWLKARNQAGEIAGATLTAVTRLGGDFGVSGKVGDVAGGGLAGLLKNIAHEFADLQVRVIDHAIEATEAAIGSETVTEICSLAGPVEVGYGASGRQQLLAVEQPLAGHGSGLEAVAAGSVWLVTGGARGVTAACGLALGKQYGLRLALVGSTRPVPLESDWLERDEAGLRELKGQLMVEAKARGEDPRQAWRAVEKSLEIARSLAACTAAGVTAKYFACDLADEVAAGRLVAEVERSIGPIRGLLHGAGYEAACRFEKKTPAGLAATVGPKVLGLEHLLAAIDPQQLRAVIGFGSTSGRFGGHGQADYSLANDLLAKIVAKLRHGNGIPATVFHWHAWDEVGMASRPESRFVLEQFGLQFMPLAEGVGHFLREIAGGLPAAEVILTEPAFCEAAGPVRQATAAALPPQPTASPLADGSRGSLVATVATEGTVSHVGFQLDPTRDQFLLQHTQYGRPLLPAVMAAELLAQAVRAAGLAKTVQELREVQIERPVNFPTDRTRTVEVRVGPENGPSVAAVGWAPVLNAAGQPAGEPRPHISGRVVIGPAEPITRQLDEQPFPFNPMVYQEDAPLHHGRAFRTLSGLFLDRSGGWARLTAPDPNVVAASRGAAGWTVPIALLDGCIVACAVYSYILLGKRVEVPLRFERLRMVAQPQVAEACTLRLFYRQHDAQETVYDFTLYGDDGQPLLALDGLHLAVVPSREAR